MTSPLADRHAQRGKVARLSDEEARRLLSEVPGWKLATDAGHPQLERRFELPTFRALIAFVNRIAELAEAEDHHPDFCVHYRQLDVTLWTHDASGVSDNDFILAAKIDALPPNA